MISVEKNNMSDCGDNLKDTTILVTECGMQSSVEIQNNAGSSVTADEAASFACKCTQNKTATGAELLAEQRWGCILQFSVKSDYEVVEFQLNTLIMKLSNFN